MIRFTNGSGHHLSSDTQKETAMSHIVLYDEERSRVHTHMSPSLPYPFHHLHQHRHNRHNQHHYPMSSRDSRAAPRLIIFHSFSHPPLEWLEGREEEDLTHSKLNSKGFKWSLENSLGKEEREGRNDGASFYSSSSSSFSYISYSFFPATQYGITIKKKEKRSKMRRISLRTGLWKNRHENNCEEYKKELLKGKKIIPSSNILLIIFSIIVLSVHLLFYSSSLLFPNCGSNRRR